MKVSIDIAYKDWDREIYDINLSPADFESAWQKYQVKHPDHHQLDFVRNLYDAGLATEGEIFSVGEREPLDDTIKPILEIISD